MDRSGTGPEGRWAVDNPQHEGMGRGFSDGFHWRGQQVKGAPQQIQDVELMWFNVGPTS